MNKSVTSVLFLIMFFSGQISGQNPKRFSRQDTAIGIVHHFEVNEGFFGGGACVIDFNNDGKEDLFLTGGMTDDKLYLNLGNGSFKDVYSSSGLQKTRSYVTQGVASADVNKDGFPDLLITTNNRKDVKLPIPRAENLLFLNNGDGTFRDATKEFGLEKLHSFSAGVSFGDINKDGYPDAYIANYFHNYDGPLNAINDQTIVNASRISEGFLLINEKGKKFVNKYQEYGLNHKGFGFGGVFTDFDNDGDQDLIINHDFGYKATPNVVLENLNPEPKMRYVGEEIGLDLSLNAMTTAVGDIDDDGQLEYYTTNIRFNKLMKKIGDKFQDLSDSLGTNNFSISWGANFCDFDHDGDLDLYVANGDLNPNCNALYNFYFENIGGKFSDKSIAFGLADPGIGRGSVIFDFDNDGDEDIFLVNQKPVYAFPASSESHLFRNDSTIGNYLQVKLRGSFSESSGIGSRLIAFYDRKAHLREIDGGCTSYLSQNSTIAHFGLGNLETIDSLIVYWPSGEKSILTEVKANQKIEITEQTPIIHDDGHWFIYGVIAIILLTLILGFIRVRKRL